MNRDQLLIFPDRTKLVNESTQVFKVFSLDISGTFPYMVYPLGSRVMEKDKVTLENLLSYLFCVDALAEYDIERFKA